MKSILIITILVIINSLTNDHSLAENAIGCKFQSSLCEAVEVCVDDAAFGQCQVEPFDVHQYDLEEAEQELLRLELTKLALKGDDWASQSVQCILHYFFLTHRYGLIYDAEFCNVRNLENILTLLKVMEQELRTDGTLKEISTSSLENVEPITEEQALYVPETDGDPSDTKKDGQKFMVATRSLNGANNLDPLLMTSYEQTETNDDDDDDGFFMSRDEEKLLNSYIAQMIRGQKPEFSQLSGDQLKKFIAYVDLLKAAVNTRLRATTGEVVSEDEIQGAADLEKFLYKKDEEKLGILNQGTSGKEHRIQTRDPRGFRPTPAPNALLQGQRRIEGDRVYIKLTTNITDIEDVARLMEYLEEKVGEPNNITFSDVEVHDNEVSFKVHNVDELTQEWLDEVMERPNTKLVEALNVAGLTYNLLKKSKLASEVGVGDGEADNSVAVKRVDEDDEDSFVLTTLIVCGLVVGSLIVVLGIYVYRSRSRAKSSLQRLAADLEGPAGKDYEELCRQRMSAKTEGAEPLSGIVGTLAQRLGSQSDQPSPPPNYHSKHSSTSSWSEEPVQTNMDISTGHMILSYMEDHLLNKDRLEQEWKELEAYQPDVTVSIVAHEAKNEPKNRNKDVVPYDHNRVILNEASNLNGGNYINASFICDHDPRNPAYIACQAPFTDTVADFWQMVWEQGSVVIVNLTKLMEAGEAKCHRYWPENGSEVHHIYEIHLVSEHIWCEDYLVRSFYLKNLRTQETRTVTQFHFLTWPEDGVPSSSKALLEFRRKVNKSYRGRSCPIVVHCGDGGGRTGTYILLDMVLNRISKGVKEIDIAAALEHLRDQRTKSIRTMEQFEFVLASVAEEVQAVLKALPQ